MHLLSLGKQKALFNPDVGMNLMSYSLDGLEVIDQKTMPLFKERMAGLGALIGPHFHHRKEEEIPKVDVSKLFAFIEKMQEKGQKEFFSHGIARYVPWKYQGGESSIRATLSGEDQFQGHSLKEIEGKSFDLSYKADLKEDGLHIKYEMSAEKPSVIGLHYYYSLPNLQGEVVSQVDSKYHHPDGWREIPSLWLQKNKLHFKVDASTEADFGFRPIENQNAASITLNTDTHQVVINYLADSHENAWQLYHPKEATYVCIEPVSAQNPREAKLLSAKLSIHIQIQKIVK